MNILEYGKEILKLEIFELQRIENMLDENFEKVVNVIFKTKGKVVITGIGKSGLIGKKIAATLMSTGTTAVFMNAAEASHGDLGMITKDDTVIVISNSGSSSEVLSIMPSLNIIGCNTIAFTGNLDSILAHECQMCLYIGVTKEACPMNVAPTSSTTVLLAVGDALALTIMKLRNFKQENFAVFHPGGALGRRLLLKIKDLMISYEELPLLLKTASIEEVIEKLAETRTGAVCITDDSRKNLLGIITDGDLKRFFKNKNNFFSLKADEMMTKNPKTINFNEKAYDALIKMEQGMYQISFLPVLDDDFKLIGGLRIHDLLKVK